MAGAAFLFVIAGAYVSFRGWPEISSHPAPTAAYFASVAPRPAATSDQKVVAAFAQVAARPATVAAPPKAAATRTGGQQITVSGPGGVVATLVGRQPTGVPSSPPPSVSSTGPVHPVSGALGTGVGHAAGNLASTLTKAGGGLATAVGSVSGALGGVVARVNPKLGTTVTTAGSAIASAVSNTTAALGSVVTGGGKGVGALLTQH